MNPATVRRSALAAVASLAVLAPVAAHAAAGARQAAPVRAAGPEGGTIAKTFTSSGLTVSISGQGNILALQPTGQANHAYSEGYVACWSGGSAAETRITSDNWGAASVTYPSGTTMRVIRTTADGRLKLQQDFTFAASTRRVMVKNIVTNVGASTITGLTFRRHANFDANATGADVYGRTADSAFAYDDGLGGAAVTHVSASSGVTHDTKVVNASGVIQCPMTGLVTPATGDSFGAILYTIGNLAPGKSKTMTVAYSVL